MSSLHRFLAVSLFLVCSFACPRLHAESMRLAVDWGRALALGESWVHDRKHHKDHASPIASLRHDSDDDESSFLGTNPRFSIVLRDWEGGHHLAGGLLSVTDAIRMSRSSRMLLSRMTMTSGQVMPFVQFGAGQWRVDKDMQPFLPKDVELAALLGCGFDFALTHNLAVALETDWTILYRETREATNIGAAHIFSSFAALRWEL
jgi:hypothetical protein